MPGASRGKWNSWTLNSKAFSAARQEQLPKAGALFSGFPSSQPRALGDWREARTVEPNVNPKTKTRFPSPLCFTLPFLLTHRKRQILTGHFSPFSFYLKNAFLNLPLTTPSPYTGLWRSEVTHNKGHPFIHRIVDCYLHGCWGLPGTEMLNIYSTPRHGSTHLESQHLREAGSGGGRWSWIQGHSRRGNDTLSQTKETKLKDNKKILTLFSFSQSTAATKSREAK